MTVRTATLAFVLTASAMVCSHQLPQPNTASAALDPTTTTILAAKGPKSGTPCRDWDRIGSELEWSIDGCFTRPYVDTSPPPFNLAYNVWSDEGELRMLRNAPWKHHDSVQQPKRRHTTPEKPPRMLTLPRDERVSHHRATPSGQRGG